MFLLKCFKQSKKLKDLLRCFVIIIVIFKKVSITQAFVLDVFWIISSELKKKKADIMEGLEIPFSCFKRETKEQQWQQKSEKALSHQNHHSVEQLWNRCVSHHLYTKNQGGDTEYINKDNKATSLKSVPLLVRYSSGRLVKRFQSTPCSFCIM